MRRRIWLTVSLGCFALAGWFAFVRFESRLLPIPAEEPIVLAEFPGISLYVFAGGRVIEGHWIPVGDFDAGGMARVAGGPLLAAESDDGGDGSGRLRCGWIDRAGRMAIPFDWDDAHDFDDHGLAAVKRGGKWGWIDRSGAVVIAPRWQTFDRFDARGEAFVRDSGGHAIVDRKGSIRPVHEASADRATRERMSSLPGAVNSSFRSGLVYELVGEVNVTTLPSGFQTRSYRRHPIVRSLQETWEKGAEQMGGWKPFQSLDLVLSPSGAVVWRSDLHYFRFLLLPAAGVSLLLAALAYWRYRVARKVVA